MARKLSSLNADFAIRERRNIAIFEFNLSRRILVQCEQIQDPIIRTEKDRQSQERERQKQREGGRRKEAWAISF